MRYRKILLVVTLFGSLLLNACGGESQQNTEETPNFPDSGAAGTEGGSDPTDADSTGAEPGTLTDPPMNDTDGLSQGGIPLPEGSTPIVATESSGAEEGVINTTYEVPGLSAEEVQQFFTNSLEGAGYTIEQVEEKDEGTGSLMVISSEQYDGTISIVGDPGTGSNTTITVVLNSNS